MKCKTLAALPIYNEEQHVGPVLGRVLRYSENVLVVDDGSTDRTPEVLRALSGVRVLTHPENRGYGGALRSAFAYAAENGYEVLVTIDCDGQHQPKRIPEFVEACRGVDVVSGSRYLREFTGDSRPPEDRRRINRQITDEVNRLLGLNLTDAFCGFKAYRVAAIADLPLSEDGYAMPLEFWVRAAERRLRIVELPVPLIYLDEARSFGGSLDNAQSRLNVYRDVLRRSLEESGYSDAPAPLCATDVFDCGPLRSDRQVT